MLSVAHTLISLPFGVYLENPIFIFLAAATFHFFCDTLLHWNIYPDEMKKYPVVAVASDVIGGVVVAWLLVGSSLFTLPILAAIAGGNAPDVLHGLWELLSKRQQKTAPQWVQKTFAWHDGLQLETKNVAAGLVSQITLVIVALLLLY